MARTDRRYGSPRWQRLTRDVQRRDLYACHWCGRPSELTDHVIRSDQRPDLFWDPANLVAACRSCNTGRRYHGDAWTPPQRTNTTPRPPPLRPVPIKPRIW